VHWCVYRSVNEGGGSFLDIVISVNGLIFTMWCTARLKLWWWLSFYLTAKRSAPSWRNVRRQMHLFRSVECLLMLLISCVIVITWDIARFMAISMRLLGLHLLRMLSANSLYEFIMPSRTRVSLHRSSFLLTLQSVWRLLFPSSSKLSKTRASYIMIPKKALLVAAVAVTVDQ